MIDNEENRLNECGRYVDHNFSACDEKIPFDTIFLTDVEQLRKIIRRIDQTWNVRSGHGTMSQ